MMRIIYIFIKLDSVEVNRFHYIYIVFILGIHKAKLYQINSCHIYFFLAKISSFLEND